jgi:hypothetical protein
MADLARAPHVYGHTCTCIQVLGLGCQLSCVQSSLLVCWSAYISPLCSHCLSCMALNLRSVHYSCVHQACKCFGSQLHGAVLTVETLLGHDLASCACCTCQLPWRTSRIVHCCCPAYPASQCSQHDGLQLHWPCVIYAYEYTNQAGYRMLACLQLRMLPSELKQESSCLDLTVVASAAARLY